MILPKSGRYTQMRASRELHSPHQTADARQPTPRYKPPRPKRDPPKRGVTVTRYPWAPLIPLTGEDTSAIAEHTGQSRRTVQRWIENGLTAKDADWLAVMYGDSAGRLWRDTSPAWYDVEVTEADDIWYDAWLRGEDIP